jgi:peptidyl-tRNA hydrolase
VQSIIDELGTQDFNRIRIGVESRQSRDMLPTDAFVLQNFSEEEIKKLQEETFPKIKLEVVSFIA